MTRTPGNVTSLRDLERASIRDFLSGQAEEHLCGRVLDYGCGTQPYRDLVKGDYHAWDSPKFPGSVIGHAPLPHHVTLPSWTELRLHPERHQDRKFDAIVCTQVIQYVPNPLDFLHDRLRPLLKKDGRLLLTGPTNWPMVEREDLWRFTAPGITKLLLNADLEVELVYERASVDFQGERWPIGWAAVAHRPHFTSHSHKE